jgi:hypothetical protein
MYSYQLAYLPIGEGPKGIVALRVTPTNIHRPEINIHKPGIKHNNSNVWWWLTRGIAAWPDVNGQ